MDKKLDVLRSVHDLTQELEKAHKTEESSLGEALLGETIAAAGKAVERSIEAGDPASAIGKTVSAMQDPASAIGKTVSAIQDPVSAIGKTVSAMQDPVSAIEKTVSAMQDPVSAIEKTVSAIQDPVSAIGKTVSAIQDTVSVAENSVTAQMVKDAIARRDSFPKKDYSEKKERAAALEAIEGHPLSTFKKENDAFCDLVRKFRDTRDELLLPNLCELSIHYAKKGDLIYPLLKVQYGVVGPSDLMWTEDDEIRDELSSLSKDTLRGKIWNTRVDAVLKRAEEVAFKEQNILFPICAVNFTEDEWVGIYRDSKDYDTCFGISQSMWQDGETKTLPERQVPEGEIAMVGGHMTVEQLTALLNTIPMEITFVDGENINRYFNEGPKVFKRPSMAIDRDVFSCHPPKVEAMVRKVITEFREGTKDVFPIWMEKNGRTLFVQYMAVRDKNRNYLGTMEIVQDMEFAKAHFSSKER